jgi:N-methylhydantoinase A
MISRVGVDIGGTFTDFVVVGEDGSTLLWKEDSTPGRPEEAIEKGLSAIAEMRGIDRKDLLKDGLFVHGNTIATNELIERSGPKVGLLCTEGFRDILYFRDGYKPDRYNIQLQRPKELVDRYCRLGVRERMGAGGEEFEPLNEDDVRQAAVRFREFGVEAVGVAFLWSVVDPRHEERAVEILREELPGIDVINSAEILPEMREWARCSATVLSAYILPAMSDYLGKLEGVLEGHGLKTPPLIMQINGGCAYVEEILKRPVNVLASGPAAAPSAARQYFDELGTNDVITVDMGGTSFDVCLIRDGRPAMSRTIQVESQPIGVAGVEVNSIGAGGGSIAWIDAGGALRVGPSSAGAVPGPAAYGAGGDSPTVTDANIVLGYLDPAAFLGGRRNLDAARAADVVRRDIAEPLGLDVTDGAAGVIKVVDENMLGGIRAVSVERGIDPRRYGLVAGGGAGALHAARLARALGIPRVFVPAEAGTLCAFGMTATDVRHDYLLSLHGRSDEIEPSALDEPLAKLRQQALDRLHADGFESDAITLEFAVDARYSGQIHELTVLIPEATNYTATEMREIEKAFHAQHEQQFTYSLRDLPVEFLHWRVTAIGRTTTPAGADPGEGGDAEAARVGTREAYFAERGGMTETAVYDGTRLAAGAEVRGPAVIQAENTTIVLNAGDVATAKPGRGFFIDIGEVG